MTWLLDKSSWPQCYSGPNCLWKGARQRCTAVSCSYTTVGLHGQCLTITLSDVNGLLCTIRVAIKKGKKNCFPQPEPSKSLERWRCCMTYSQNHKKSAMSCTVDILHSPLVQFRLSNSHAESYFPSMQSPGNLSVSTMAEPLSYNAYSLRFSIRSRFGQDLSQTLGI
jgi:hypothetical protein